MHKALPMHPLALLLLAACGADPAPADTAPTDTAPTDTADTADETADPGALARCDYSNPFSDAAECKEYTGSGWDLALAEADCQAPVIGGDPGLLVPGEACPRDAVVGECTVDGGEPTETVTVVPGEAPEACSAAELGCTFAGGVFVAGEVCLDGGEGGGVSSEEAFVPFEQVCRDPVEGEPPGASDGGQVCTWQAISGATEEGRRFEDYADCEVVRSQRPYWVANVTADTPADDPRLSDPAWMAELDWVTAQVQASACVCCHSADLAPAGPSGWYLEAGPIWVDTLDDDGLAVLAGWVDSTVFGAFPAAENNGFSRDQTGILTTDVPRMQAFLEGELARRGLEPADFADTPPFGGPLYEQLAYEPQACTGGEGVDADGTVTWTGGPVRYLYVLEADADNPGVPPNLDLPEGTLWRLDVDHTAEPVPSGIAYGEVPDGAVQAWPTAGEPPPLQPGETYYLVALLDIYQPATRCLFVAGQ